MTPAILSLDGSPINFGRRFVATALLVAVVTSSLTACELVAKRVAGEGAPQISPTLDAIVLKYLDSNNIPGATVAVTKSSRLVWSKGYGVAHISTKEQMHPWHRTRIGSVSKVPTTIGLLQLMQQGKVDLDRHVYASWASALWGTDPETVVGIASAPDGMLENAGRYLGALPEAVKTLAPAEGDTSTVSYLKQGDFKSNVEEVLDWATSIRVRHLLTHTSGMLNSGDSKKAAAVLEGVSQADLTYPDLHEGMLKGAGGPPFLFHAGAGHKYSNHGFGLIGQIIAEASGSTYVEYMQEHVFLPLGLGHVVPRDQETEADSNRDASSYVEDDEGNIKLKKPGALLAEPPLGTPTGGWLATAQDLARVMCGIDLDSNNLRLLQEDTVDTMKAVPFIGVASKQPLGWDKTETTSEWTFYTKDGKVPRGGGSRITKFHLRTIDPDAEINVAVSFNVNKVPSEKLLKDVAKTVAEAEIPLHYDLFDTSPCYLTPSMGAVGASPSPSIGLTMPAPMLSPTEAAVAAPESRSTPAFAPSPAVRSPVPATSPEVSRTPAPSPASPQPAAGSSALCSLSGGSLAVEPDPIHLDQGVYRGRFTIHHCSDEAVRWTVSKPPSVSTSSESGTSAEESPSR